MASADGADAFRATSYSHWPVIALVLNLPPSERFKIRNIHPLFVVPGPKSPSDFVSFFQPFLDEIEALGEGNEIKFWDGSWRKVRVHLVLVGADMSAKMKLANTKGPNGLCPCWRCTIHGVWVPERRHMYYPDKVLHTVTRNGKRQKVSKTLWDINNLPLRTEKNIENAISGARDAMDSGDDASAERILKESGLASPHLTALVERPHTMRAFRSFPIDLMHLLYQNVAPFIFSHWTGSDSSLVDFDYLRDKRTVDFIDKALTDSKHGFSSAIRRPRSLSERGSWKATEWKFFVIYTSMPVLHDLIPAEALDGWWLFSRLCEILSR